MNLISFILHVGLTSKPAVVVGLLLMFQVLCTGGYDGTVLVWVETVSEPVRFPSQGNAQVNVLLGVAPGRLLVGSTNGGFLWDLATAECLVSISPPEVLGDEGDWFSAAEVLPQHFCVGGRKGILSIWSFKGDEVAMNDVVHRNQWIQSLKFVGRGHFCSASNEVIFLCFACIWTFVLQTFSHFVERPCIRETHPFVGRAVS